jgi:hypothetical protein
VGFALFAASDSTGIMLLALFFFALTVGFNTTLPAAFWAEFYGTGRIGSIKAMAAAIMVLGSAIGPGVTGVALDLGLGIETQYALIASYFVFSTVMMMVGVARAKPLLPATP